MILNQIFVEDAKKWVGIMRKEKPDIIVAVAHTVEKPKKPRNPGNRIQDLAQQVDGIDAIVSGHNHVQIEQLDYKNKSGENVIVTETGKYGECISKINFKLENSTFVGLQIEGFWGEIAVTLGLIISAN
ncbi:hypothetical protein [Clostridioides sp. ES-S-0108-01]|uniref:hypothetical protein n=1 Tax=Clostridioides sp. ES-S-0108-01 TaxID=2770773 RepID=UPI001D0C21AF